MVPWPSGKARVCKTLIPQFKSGRYLQKEHHPKGWCSFWRNRTVRFEDLNATVQWTVARDGSTERNDNPRTYPCADANKSGWYLPKSSNALHRNFYFFETQACDLDCYLYCDLTVVINSVKISLDKFISILLHLYRKYDILCSELCLTIKFCIT